MIVQPMLTKIIRNDRHFAQNGPTGIRIHTGTRYFAAVLLQEWYEFTRYAFWFWGVPVALWAAAWGGYALGLDDALCGVLAAAGVAFMFAVSVRVLPLNLDDRELTGQAIEIAAVKLFYKRENMDSEYRIQARSMIRSDSPYVAKGYWSDVEPIDPNLYTNEDARMGTYHPSIEAMVVKLKSRQSFAERYVKAHRTKLAKWKPLGEGDRGY
jgi:hypothetical protein